MSEGSVTQIPPTAIADLVAAGAAFVDVRGRPEVDAGTAAGASWNPMDAFDLSALDPGMPVVLICRSGIRSDAVADALAERGFTAYNVIGGMISWQAAGLPVVAADGTPGQVF